MTADPHSNVVALPCPGIPPEWLTAARLLQQVIPFTDRQAAALVAAGFGIRGYLELVKP